MTKDKSTGRKAPRTKTGCWTCRERKVRCDEAKPICVNCTRLGLDCAGYGARITFRDDTPRVIQRMEPVTDVKGCAVYGDLSEMHGSCHRMSSRLRYKTYTPAYFEKHKDIEIETELLETSSQLEQPSTSHEALSLRRLGQQQLQPSTMQFEPRQDRRSMPLLLRHEGNGGEGQHGLNAPPLLQSPYGAMDSQPWSPNATTLKDPLANQLPVYQYSNPRINQQLYASHFTPRATAHSQPSFSLTKPETLQLVLPQSSQRPQIVIDTSSETHTQHNRSRSYGSSPSSVALGSVGHRSPGHSPFTPFSGIPTSANLSVPVSHPSRRRRSTMASEASEQRPTQSPSYAKWAEHFGAHGVSSASSLADLDEVKEVKPSESIPQDLLDYLKTLVPAEVEADELYLKHYFSDIAAQLSYPDRGPNNPFRILLLSLCPREPALLHAVLALSATDMAHNDAEADAESAFRHAQNHYDAAAGILSAQLNDVRHEQSTAALATSLFLDLTDVKNVRPISQTATLLRIVKARAAAGRIYEGGICWTWFNATLGVCSALFGGPVLVMPYLIESDQLPTVGQGNMYPFVKKSEQERIEHTVISPMFLSQMQTWTIQSKLSILANSTEDFSSDDFLNALSALKAEIEGSWERRAKLVDDLTSDTVEEVFLTKWNMGVPIAEHIVAAHHMTRLYVELLRRASYTPEELKTSVSAIVKIFDGICAAGECFKRRMILIPVFLCCILSPDFSMRKQVIRKLAQAVGTEASWNKALEVSNALLQEEMMTKETAEKTRGYGTIKWSDVRDRLGGIVLL